MSSPKAFKRKKICQSDFISDSSDIEEGFSGQKECIECVDQQNRNKENVLQTEDYHRFSKKDTKEECFDAFSQINTSQTATWKPCNLTSPSKAVSHWETPKTADGHTHTELKKIEKERVRMVKKQMRAEKLIQKEKDKQMKNVIRETKAQFSLKDCLKYISVMVDPNIINDLGLGAAIYKACEDIGVCCITEAQAVPYSVTWRREITEVNTEGSSIIGVRKNVTEDEVLGIIPVKEFVDMVSAFKKRHGAAVGTTLTDYVKTVKGHYQGRKYTCIVQGMEQYFRECKTMKQRQHREAVESLSCQEMKSNRNRKKCSIEVSRVDVEEALTDVQLNTECSIRLVGTGQDVADLIRTFTKAVAEKPVKKDRLTSIFSFHEEGTGAIKVDKSGNGLLKVWKHQLMQFKNVSPDIADALIAAYPSPRLLLNMYKKCSSDKEAIHLLSDIVVRRGAGVLGTSRRVGKETGRRIFLFMTSRDPSTVIK